LLKAALSVYETDFDDFPPSNGDGIKGAASLYKCLTTEKKNGPYIKLGELAPCTTEDGSSAFADGWNRPVYYLHHHDYRNKPPNKRDYRLMSAGPNGVYESGNKGSDDIVNWEIDNP
jgi:hypothetical protein